MDPLLQYDSPYTYCGNNPINIIDPTGMYGEEFQEDKTTPDNLAPKWAPGWNPKSRWEEYEQSKNNIPSGRYQESYNIAGGPGDPNNEFPNSYVAKEVTVYGTDPNTGEINYFSGTEEYSHRHFRYSFVEGIGGHASFRVKGYINITKYNGIEYLSVFASSYSAANMMGDVYYNGNVSLYDGDLLLGTYPLNNTNSNLYSNVLKEVGKTELIPLPKRGFDNINVKISVGYNISTNRWQGVTSVRKGNESYIIGDNVKKLDVSGILKYRKD